MQAQRNRHPHFITIQCGDRFLGLLGGCDSPLSTLNLAGNIVVFKPSNRTGGPRTDVWRLSHIFLTWIQGSRKNARDVLRSLTQPLYLLGSSNLGGCAAFKRSHRVRRKLWRTYSYFRLRTQKIWTATISWHPDHRGAIFPYWLYHRSQLPLSRANHLSRPAYSPHVRARCKILPRRLSYLPLPDHESVAPYASLAIRLACSSQNGLLTLSEWSKTAQLHNMYNYEYRVVRWELFIRQDRRTIKMASVFQLVCYIPSRSSCVRSLAIDIAEALECMFDVKRIVEGKGKGSAASMLRKFHSKAKHMLWNLDEEVIVNVFLSGKGMRPSECSL